MLEESRPAVDRRASTASSRSGPSVTCWPISVSRSRDSPSVVPTDTSARSRRSRSSDIPASSMAILAAATENWLARPSSSGSMVPIHSRASKSATSHPLACAKPVVSNAVIGLTPLLPDRSPARKPGTPMPTLLITPRPVITTVRSGCCFAFTVRLRSGLGGCSGLVDDRDDAVEVDHPGQLGLVDLDAEGALQRREDLDGAQRVGVVVLLEQTGVGHLLRLDLEDLAHDVLDRGATVLVDRDRIRRSHFSLPSDNV